MKKILEHLHNELILTAGASVPCGHEDRLFQLQPRERVVVRHPDGRHELPDPHRRQPPHAQRHVRGHARIRPQTAGTLSNHPNDTLNEFRDSMRNGAKFKFELITGHVEPVAHLAPALPAVEQDPGGAARHADLALGGVRAVRLQGELWRLALSRNRGTLLCSYIL